MTEPFEAHQHGTKIRAFVYHNDREGGKMHYPNNENADHEGNPTIAALAEFYAVLARKDSDGCLIAFNSITPFYEIHREENGDITKGDSIFAGDIVLCTWRFGFRTEYSQYVIDYDVPSTLHWGREIGEQAVEVFASSEIDRMTTSSTKTLYEMMVIGNSYEQRILLLGDEEEGAI